MFANTQRMFHKTKEYIQSDIRNHFSRTFGFPIESREEVPINSRARISEFLRLLDEIITSNTSDNFFLALDTAAGTGGFLIALQKMADIEITSPLIAYLSLPVGFAILFTVLELKYRYFESVKKSRLEEKDFLSKILKKIRNNHLFSLTIERTNNELIEKFEKEMPEILSPLKEHIYGPTSGRRAIEVFDIITMLSYTGIATSGAVYVYFILYMTFFATDLSATAKQAALGLASSLAVIAMVKMLRDKMIEYFNLEKHREEIELDLLVDDICERLHINGLENSLLELPKYLEHWLYLDDAKNRQLQHGNKETLNDLSGRAKLKKFFHRLDDGITSYTLDNFFQSLGASAAIGVVPLAFYRLLNVKIASPVAIMTALPMSFAILFTITELKYRYVKAIKERHYVEKEVIEEKIKTIKTRHASAFQVPSIKELINNEMIEVLEKHPTLYHAILEQIYGPSRSEKLLRAIDTMTNIILKGLKTLGSFTAYFIFHLVYLNNNKPETEAVTDSAFIVGGFLAVLSSIKTLLEINKSYAKLEEHRIEIELDQAADELCEILNNNSLANNDPQLHLPRHLTIWESQKKLEKEAQENSLRRDHLSLTHN